MPSGLRVLEAELTNAGRSDWVRNLYGAHLSWVDEYVAVILRPCKVGICPYHSRDLDEVSAKRAQRITWECERRARKLELAGWTVVDVWDCQLESRAKEVAGIIVGALEGMQFGNVEQSQVDGTPRDSELGAKMAQISALQICTMDEWIEFLAMICGFYSFDRMQTSKKQVVDEAVRGGWDKRKFMDLWTIARRELLIEFGASSIHVGPSMGPACDAVGLPRPVRVSSIPKMGMTGPRSRNKNVSRKGVTIYVDDVPREAPGAGGERGLADPRSL